MRKPKTKRIRVVGGYYDDSPFFKMTHDEFVEYCGGKIAVALFKGELKGELHTLLSMAHARGMMYQLEYEN